MDNLLLSKQVIPADVRDIVDAAQAGDAACRVLLAPFAGFSAANASEIVRSAISRRHEGQRFPDVRLASIVKIAKRFHDNAGTTEPVEYTLDALTSGAPLIRMSFTPDHFAGLSMYGEALFAARLEREFRARGRPAAQVIIIVDSEVAGDKRSRSSTFPDLKRAEGLLRLICTPPETSAARLSAAVSAPARADVETWMRDLRSSVRIDQRLLGRAGIAPGRERTSEALDFIEEDMIEAQRRARNLADFNMIFASRILNLRWNLSTAFVSLREASPFFMDAYALVFSRFDEIVAQSQLTRRLLSERGIMVADNTTFPANLLPFWLICPDCMSRVTMTLSGRPALHTSGKCAGCSRKFSADLNTRTAPDLGPLRDHLVPRLLFDDLTNGAVWDVMAGVSNAGSVRHMVAAYDVAAKLGLAVPSEALLRLRGIYFGPAEARIAQLLHTAPRSAVKFTDVMRRIFWGKTSILYYLVSQGVVGLRDMWKSSFDRDDSLAAVNIASSPFDLPAAARQALIDVMSQLPPR